MKKLYIHFMAVIVGQACNLHCKNCSNFAPFAPKKMMHYDAEEIIGQLKTITKYATIRLLQIQGGEPFLYSDLNSILEFVARCPEIKKCLIATNGTIIPGGGIKWRLLQDNKFIVRVSNYPVAADKSAKVQAWLEEHKIRYEIYHFVSKDDKWFDMGREMDCQTADKAEQDKAEDRFQNCLFQDCLTMENGLMGRCARSVISAQVQGFLPGEGDYLPVIDELDFPEKLEQYLDYPRHMEACCHCNGTEKEHLIEVAVQLKTEKG